MPSVPSASTGTFMNQFTLLVMSRLPMPAPRVREEEVVDARVLVPGVEAVAQRVRLATARAADGVVAFAVRRGDRHHRPALVGEQLRAGDQEDVPLGHHRVGRAVALGGIVGVVEDAVDRLVALEVDDLQRAAGLDHVGPRRRARRAPRRGGRRSRRRSRARARTPRSAGTRARPRGSPTTRRRRAWPAASRPRGDAQRRHRVLGPGIEHVRRVGHHHDHRQLGPQLDVRARRRPRARRTRSAPSGATTARP